MHTLEQTLAPGKQVGVITSQTFAVKAEVISVPLVSICSAASPSTCEGNFVLQATCLSRNPNFFVSMVPPPAAGNVLLPEQTALGKQSKAYETIAWPTCMARSDMERREKQVALMEIPRNHCEERNPMVQCRSDAG